MHNNHTFHIPVMGIGYTLDTPINVAHYGISSVLSLGDDMLMERLREFYCEKFGRPFYPIPESIYDARAKRITAYLNMVDEIVKEKFDALKNSATESESQIDKYIRMLPDYSNLKIEYNNIIKKYSITNLRKWLEKNLSVGSIDVNIMTKLDKANYENGEALPAEFCNAHAALRGFANSTLRSSVVFSAGMNPRLYSYIENFEDFYPDENGEIKKKIILKVSDYRSALIQGKFLAKKGLWISEYRVESGLNCGGHAFATQGYLMGPILEEFKSNKEELISSIYELYSAALNKKERNCPTTAPEFTITAQGGVGTSKEHNFLLDHYQLGSVGWGTPFLLVPEAISIDEETLNKLSAAKEHDLYLSHASPLGVLYNNLKDNAREVDRKKRIEEDKPGSPCLKKYLLFNTEFTDKPICTASRQYQSKKIKELKSLNLSDSEYKKEYDKVVAKECICPGLGSAVLLKNGMELKLEVGGVSICPGPNMAYYDKEVSLEDMISHIYGKSNIISRKDRPNMFLKELMLYIDYFKNSIREATYPLSEKQGKYFQEFRLNLENGIEYYQNLFSESEDKFESSKDQLITELTELENELKQFLKIK